MIISHAGWRPLLFQIRKHQHLDTQNLVNEFFCRFSMREQLHSDQGRQFEFIFIAKICRTFHFRKTRTTPYHPQGDGMVEKVNGTLVNMLATSISDLENDSWEKLFS